MDIDICSYNGYSGVDGDRLYFIDKFYGFLYIIAPSGTVLQRHLGLGNGPNEIFFRPGQRSIFVDNELVIFGNTYDAYLFNDLQNRETIRLKIPEKRNSMDDFGVYTTLDVVRKSGERYYCFIYSENPFCNPVLHSKDYFSKAHIFMEINLKNGEQKPIGHFSKHYIENHKNLNHLFLTYYDIDKKGNFYVSHQADSLIYLYNAKFNFIKAFGFKGVNMDTHYGSALPSWEDFNKVCAKDYPNKGYYTWLEYVEETNMTFRSYQKGSHTEFDGLQIYKDGVLVADVEVPKKFRVAGYAYSGSS